MKNKVCLNLFILVLMSFSTSCTKYSFEIDPEENNEKQFVIKPQIYISDPWQAVSRAIGENDPLFMCYLFDGDGNGIYNDGGTMGSDMKTTFNKVTQTGHYSIYCVTGWFKDEYPRTTKFTELYKEPITLDTELFMCSAKDICLGSKAIYVNETQYAYDVMIEVNHIMAKASFEITNVPDEITAISVTLPKQANKFKFGGTIIGNEQSQTLALTRNSEPNSKGGDEGGSEGKDENSTYNWSIDETIVYPYAQESGTMPIHLTVTNSSGSYTFETNTSICCTSGKRVAYKTDWSTMKYSQNTQININPWTETVIDADFNLGGAVTN